MVTPTIVSRSPRANLVPVLPTAYRYGELGSRLRAARVSEGISVQRAAELCEVAPWQYLSFENGKRKAPATGLLALQSEHGLDREWIVTGASLTDRLLMLNDIDLVRMCDFAPEDLGGLEAPTAVQLRSYITNRRKSDHRWHASVELFLAPPPRMVLRDRVDAAAQLFLRVGSLVFGAQFMLLVVVVLLIAALGMKSDLVSGVLAASMAISMLLIAIALLVHMLCLEAEKRAVPVESTLAFPPPPKSASSETSA